MISLRSLLWFLFVLTIARCIAHIIRLGVKEPEFTVTWTRMEVCVFLICRLILAGIFLTFLLNN